MDGFTRLALILYCILSNDKNINLIRNLCSETNIHNQNIRIITSRYEPRINQQPKC